MNQIKQLELYNFLGHGSVQNPSSNFHKQNFHFIQNHKLTAKSLWNANKFLDLGVWGLETTFAPLEPKIHIKQ